MAKIENGVLISVDPDDIVDGTYQIPEGVKVIGNGAFFYCTGLTSISIPNSVTSIGYGAFAGCTGLTSISISNSITSIEDHSFCNCTGLTSISIPNSEISIGAYAFRGCTNLTSVTFLGSIPEIGDGAFANCKKLEVIRVPEGVTISSKQLERLGLNENIRIEKINPNNIENKQEPIEDVREQECIVGNNGQRCAPRLQESLEYHRASSPRIKARRRRRVVGKIANRRGYPYPL